MKNNRIKKIIANIVAALMCTCSVPFYASAENNAERIHDDVLNETDISLAMQTSIPRMKCYTERAVDKHPKIW